MCYMFDILKNKATDLKCFCRVHSTYTSLLICYLSTKGNKMSKDILGSFYRIADHSTFRQLCGPLIIPMQLT